MRRSNDRKKIFVIAAVVFAAAGFLATAILLRGADAREAYFKAESRNFERTSQWINDRYTSFIKKQERYINNTYKRRMEVTADVEAGGKPFGLKDAGSLFDFIKKCKLVVDSRQQPGNSTSLSNISLLVEKVPFLDAELFTEDRKLYFSVPVVLPGKYFSLKLDQMDEVYDKFSIPIKPKRLVTATGIAKTIRFDKTALDKSVKNLGSIFSNRIGKKDVRYGEDRELIISGQVVKGREILVSLDPQAATALLHDLAGFISSDVTLLDYTYGNFADMASMLDDAGLFRLFGYLDEMGTVGLNEYEKDMLNVICSRNDLESFRESLVKELKSYSMNNGLEMAMVIDNSGNILDRKLTLDLTAPEGGNSFVINIQTGSSSMEYQDCRNRFMNVMVTRSVTGGVAGAGKGSVETGGAAGTGNSGALSVVRSAELQITPVFSKADGTGTKGNIAITCAVTPQNGVKSGVDIKLDISSLMDNTTLKKNNVIKYQADLFGENGDGSVNGEINRVTWENKKLNTLSSTAGICVQADLPSFGIKDLSAEIKLAGEDKFGMEPFTLPQLQQSDVTDLNAATERDLEKIRMELLASFGTFYLQNKPIFDMILGQ